MGETDAAFRLFLGWGVDEILDGVEDDLNPTVLVGFVPLECVDAAGKFCLRGQHLAQSNESAYDADVNFDGLAAGEDRGEHRNSMFCKDIGEVAAAAF